MKRVFLFLATNLAILILLGIVSAMLQGYLAGRQGMVAALRRLGSLAERSEPLPQQIAAAGVSSGRGGMGQLFASHPPLEERIRRLEMSEVR